MLRYELIQLAATGAEPVTLQDAKFWLQLDPDDNAQDQLVTTLITAARQYAETFCRRSFTVGETWQLTLDHFPLASLADSIYSNLPLSELFETSEQYLALRPGALAIEIPMGPVTAVTSISYIDTTGTQQTLASNAFTLLPDGDGNARIFPVFGTGWPATQQQLGGVVITFTAGATPNETVKIAIKQILAHWYANREAVTLMNTLPQEVPLAANSLLWPHRLITF